MNAIHVRDDGRRGVRVGIGKSLCNWGVLYDSQIRIGISQCNFTNADGSGLTGESGRVAAIYQYDSGSTMIANFTMFVACLNSQLCYGTYYISNGVAATFGESIFLSSSPAIARSWTVAQDVFELCFFDNTTLVRYTSMSGSVLLRNCMFSGVIPPIPVSFTTEGTQKSNTATRIEWDTVSLLVTCGGLAPMPTPLATPTPSNKFLDSKPAGGNTEAGPTRRIIFTVTPSDEFLYSKPAGGTARDGPTGQDIVKLGTGRDGPTGQFIVTLGPVSSIVVRASDVNAPGTEVLREASAVNADATEVLHEASAVNADASEDLGEASAVIADASGVLNEASDFSADASGDLGEASGVNADASEDLGEASSVNANATEVLSGSSGLSVDTTEDEKKALWKNWWFWVALVGGLLFVALVVLAIIFIVRQMKDAGEQEEGGDDGPQGDEQLEQCPPSGGSIPGDGPELPPNVVPSDAP